MVEKPVKLPDGVVEEAKIFVSNTWGGGVEASIKAETDDGFHAAMILGCSIAYDAANNESPERQRAVLIERGRQLVAKFGPKIIETLREAGFPYIDEICENK